MKTEKELAEVIEATRIERNSYRHKINTIDDSLRRLYRELKKVCRHSYHTFPAVMNYITIPGSPTQTYHSRETFTVCKKCGAMKLPKK